MTPGWHAGILTSYERPDYGVTATLCSPDGRHVETREYHGMIRPSLRVIADYCDEHDLRVVTLSTPNSILADLRGRTTPSRPENNLMGYIDRLDLLWRR